MTSVLDIVIRTISEQVSPNLTVKPDSRLVEDLGLDSLSVLKLTQMIETEFEFNRFDYDARKMLTVGDLVGCVEVQALRESKKPGKAL